MNATSKGRIGLYLAALFFAGVVTGAFGAFAVGRHLMMAAMSREKMAAHWRGELQSKLNLTPAQTEKIAPIINDAIGEFRNDFAAQILATVSNANARIAAELTPEQQPKFVEIEKQQQEFIQKRLGSGMENPQKKP
jgi:Spy/CpxP family protein refolding chaperone